MPAPAATDPSPGPRRTETGHSACAAAAAGTCLAAVPRAGALPRGAARLAVVVTDPVSTTVTRSVMRLLSLIIMSNTTVVPYQSAPALSARSEQGSAA